jgi:hypothetical protein
MTDVEKIRLAYRRGLADDAQRRAHRYGGKTTWRGLSWLMLSHRLRRGRPMGHLENLIVANLGADDGLNR